MQSEHAYLEDKEKVMKWLVRVNKPEQFKDLGEKKSTAVDWLGHVKAKNLHFTSNFLSISLFS